MASTQSFKLLNQPAGNYPVNDNAHVFAGSNGGVLGGKYVLVFVASGAGTANLQILGPDGVTWVQASTAITTTTATQSLDLPPGQYRLVITGFTANYASLTRVVYS